MMQKSLPKQQGKKKTGGHDTIIREDIMFPLRLFGKKYAVYQLAWAYHQ